MEFQTFIVKVSVAACEAVGTESIPLVFDGLILSHERNIFDEAGVVRGLTGNGVTRHGSAVVVTVDALNDRSDRRGDYEFEQHHPRVLKRRIESPVASTPPGAQHEYDQLNMMANGRERGWMTYDTVATGRRWRQ